MKEFWSFEGGFTGITGKLFDALMLGLLWLLCSIPVITVGASTTALYYAFVKCIKNNRGYPVKEFFHSFRQNFLQASVLWGLQLAALILLFGNLHILMNEMEATNFTSFLLVVYVLAIAVLLMLSLYVFPALSRYEMKTFWFLRFSVCAAVRHFGTTLILGLILAMAAVLSLHCPLLIVAAPSLCCFAASEFMERILAKYSV